jgi:hypothetical protein
MSVFLTLLPLVGGLALLVALVKLAAWLYRRARLSWGHAAGYVVLVVIGNATFGMLHKVSGVVLPLPLLFLVPLVFQALLGGWYLGSYARRADGAPLSFAQGALLAAIYLGLMFVSAIVPALVIAALRI